MLAMLRRWPAVMTTRVFEAKAMLPDMELPAMCGKRRVFVVDERV